MHMGTGRCCPQPQGLGALGVCEACDPRKKTGTCPLVSTPGQAGGWAQPSHGASGRSPPTPMSPVGVGCLGLQEGGPPLLERALSGPRPPLQPPDHTGALSSAASVHWLAQPFLPIALSGRVPGSSLCHECGTHHLKIFKMTVNSKQLGLVLG